MYAHDGVCDDVAVAAMHGGALGCQAAARHAGLWVLEATPRLHVWVGEDGHHRAHEDCTCLVHWTGGRPGRAFQSPDLVTVLLQVLQCAGDEAFFVALESALRRRKLSGRERDELRARVPDEASPLVDLADEKSDSGLESLIRLRLHRLGLDPLRQVRIPGVGLVDFALDRLLIEADGRDGHAAPEERTKDLRRDAIAALWGYRVMRVSYAMVLYEWELVEQAILSSLRRAA